MKFGNLNRRQIFAIAFVIICLRSWGRIQYSDFWAEDSIFMTDALNLGWRSVFTPYAGSYFVLQRVILLSIINLLPLILWPLATFFVCTLITAAVISRIADRDYEWIFPEPAHRNTTALLLTLTPGMNELVGNLANLNWVLFCAIALIGLKAPERPFRRKELFEILVAGFSIGSALLLVPLFLWRLVHQARKVGDRKALTSTAFCLTLLLMSGLWIYCSIFIFKVDDAFPFNHQRVDFSEILKSALHISLGPIQKSIVFRPWLGSGLATAMNDFGKVQLLAWITTILCWGGVIYWLARYRPRFGIALCAWLFGIAMMGVARAVGRPGSLETPFYVGNSYWGLRHAFPFGFAATVFWMAVLSYHTDTKFKRGLLTFFIVVSVIHGLDRFPIRPYQWGVEGYPNVLHWNNHRLRLEAAMSTLPCPQPLHVPVFPHPFYINYNPVCTD